jgi:RHS repeat-associated protein
MLETSSFFTASFTSLYDFSNAVALDIDGDGKQEIVGIKQGLNSYILTQDFSTNSNQGLLFKQDNSGYNYNPFNFSPEYSQYQVRPLPGVPYDFYGDYNGDSRSDVLNFTPNATGGGVWTLNIGKGDGTYQQYTPTAALPANPYYSALSNPIMVLDANSDGKTDLVNFYGGVNGNGTNYNSSLVPFDVYYSTGKDFILETNYVNVSVTNNLVGSTIELQVGNFNGDGNLDVVSFNGYGSIGSAFITYLNKGGESKFLSQVLDGYNNATTFKFDHLSSPSTAGFYTQTSGPNQTGINTYPYLNFRSPMHVVSSITNPDGIGGISTTSYTYQDAIRHLQGLSFLGFNTVKSYNDVSQTQTINTYSTLINPTNSSIARSIVGQQTYTLNTGGGIPFLVSKTDYTPSLFAIAPTDLRHFIGNTKKVNTDYTGATTTTTYTYDNNVTSPTNNNVTQMITNISGIETQTVTNTYDTYLDFPSTPSRVVTCTTSVNRQGQTTTYTRASGYTYNDQGDIVLSKQDPGKPKEVDISYTYYPNTGNLNFYTTSSTDGVAKTKTKTYTYDPKFRYLATYQNPNPIPQITQYTYDNKLGKPLSVIGFDNLTTTYVYDEFGKNIQITTPDGLTGTNSYDWVSAADYANWSDIINVIPNALTKITSTRPGSPTTTSFYDVFNRNIKTITDGFNNPASMVMAYDALGNLTDKSNMYDGGLSPLLTTLTYDNLARLNNVVLTDFNNGQNTEACTYQYSAGTTMVTSNINAVGSNPKTLTKAFDATGLLASSGDDYTTLYYVYGNQHSPVEIDLGTNSNPITNYIYDNDYGTLSSQNEKNTGITAYTYNAYGQLITKSDNSNNHIYTYTYDELDRITNVSCPMDGTYTYDYVPLGTAGVNQLQKVSGPTYDYNYSYDALNRPTQKIEHIGSEIFTTNLEYDPYNNVSKVTYPSGFAVIKTYDPHGYLNKINSGNGNIIWQTNTINAFGNYSAYTLGGNINMQKTYTNYGFESNYTAKVGSNFVQNYDFNFDPLTGNLLSRTDHTHGTPNNLSETFGYDKLDRLKTISGSSSLTMNYATNGNITSKSDIGTYNYDPTKINALTGVTDPNGVISQNTQTVDYNAFSKATTIKEWDVANSTNVVNELDYTYGPDQQRRKADLFDATGRINTTYYQTNYEKIVSGTNPANFTEVNYIIGGDGSICAMYVNDQSGIGNGNLYYVFKDYLGSILKLTDANGTTIAEQSFDAWGRKRNPGDWTSYVLPSLPAPPVWLIRGYTGHEHLPQFSLVNMNGRMYDPTNARVLSADNNVQDGENTQSYNRYSYCINNPLKYTDPTGYDWTDDPEDDRSDDGPISWFQSFINGIVNFFDGEPNSKYTGINNDWGRDNWNTQGAQDGLNQGENDMQGEAAYAAGVSEANQGYANFDFSNAPSELTQDLQDQVMNQVQQIFTQGGVNISVNNPNNYTGELMQNVKFGDWQPADGKPELGSTADGQLTSYINKSDFAFNYQGIAGYGRNGSTLKLANVIAHEILHGFLTRAITFLGASGSLPFSDGKGGHINSPKNILTDGSLRFYDNVKRAYNDDWIGDASNTILPNTRVFINTYIGFYSGK